MRSRALPVVFLAVLAPACVADGPGTRSSDPGEGPAPGSFLTRSGTEEIGTLVFPPSGEDRRARPALGEAPKLSVAEEEAAAAPELVSPTGTVDIAGERIRLRFDQPMRMPKGKPGDKGPVAAEPGTLTLTPEVKARAEWLGPEALDVVTEEPLTPGQRYTVALGALASERGKAIAAGTKVTVIGRAEVAGKMLSHVPKVGEPRIVAIHPHDGATVSATPEIAVLYDQPVELSKARGLVSLIAEGGAKVPVAVQHPSGPTFQGVRVDPRFVVVVKPFAPLTRSLLHWLSLGPAWAKQAPAASQFLVAPALEVTGIACPFYEGDAGCSVDEDEGTITTKGAGLTFQTNGSVSMSAKALVKRVRVSPPVRNLSVELIGGETTNVEVHGAFEPSTSYEVTLLGLEDRYGTKLAGPVTAVLRRGPTDASVTMPGGVLMLDAARMKGFEVTTRNAEEVVLSFWRVADEKLGEAMRDVHELRTPAGAPDVQVPVAVRAEENELVTTPVDLTEVLDAKHRYVASVRVARTAFEADAPKEPKGPVALVFPGNAESLAVHVERAAERTLVQVARLGTGEPVAGAKLDLLGDEATTGASGADGLALLDGQVRGLLRVSAGSAQAVVDLGHPDTTLEKLFPSLGAGEHIDPQLPRAFLFTDRGIYRPGATVNVFGNLRKADGLRLGPAAGENVVVRLIGPSGDFLFETPATTSELGSVTAAFQLGATTKLGRHQIVVDQAEEPKKTIATAIVQVAEFEAPRFLVDVDARATDERTLRASVATRYLFGAPMDGAKVTWTAKREPAAIATGAFEGAGLSFRSARESWEERPAVVWSRAGEATARTDGVAQIEQRLSLEGSTGPQRFVVEAEVTDASHRAVAARGTAIVHPAARYAGLHVPTRWAAPGERLPVELAVVDRDGKAVIGADVSAVVSRIDYTYSARRDAGGAVSHDWTRRTTKVGRCSAKSAAKVASCDVVLPVEGDYEIAAEVDGKPGGATTAWAWRRGGGGRDVAMPERGRAIDLVADRATYAPGETAKLFVTSPFEAATAIVTTDAVGAAPRVVTIDGAAGVVDIPVSAEDAPHVHAMVTLLPRVRRGDAARTTAGAGGSSVAPVEYRVGAIRLPVSMKSQRLALEVTPGKASYGPGEEAQIDLRLADGGAPVKGAQIAIAVVDEGVLRMTSFHAPDPVTELRPGRALSADVFDSRTRLADLVGQSHVAGDGDDGKSTPGARGGRGETDRSLTSARKKFAETAFWKPDVFTDDEGRATVRFKLPDNLTDFRVMAVAIENQGKGAVKETSFTVAKPFLVMPALPRFVSLGDHFEAAALVHNHTAEAAIVKVALAGKERQLLVPAHGQVRVGFPVHVTCEPLEADDDAATDGADGAHDEDAGDDLVSDDASDEVSDDRTPGGRAAARDEDARSVDGEEPADDEDTIRVCPTAKEHARPGVRLGFEARAEDGARLDAVEHEVPATFAGLDEVPRVEGAFVKRRVIDLRVPARVIGRGGEDAVAITLGAQVWPELGERMRYLLEYPHGCVEQTTSSTLPLLAARDIAPRIGMEDVSDVDLKVKIRAGIDRLATMRTGGGGLAYWPGGTEPNVYGTAYAMRVMVLAKAAGIEPPADLVSGMARYLRYDMVRVGLEPEVRAAIAQSLAELGELEAGTLDALTQDADKQSVFGAASLAIALSTFDGQEDRVAALLDQVEAGLDEAGELRTKPSAVDFHYYGSPVRTKAQAAIALRKLRPTARALPGLIRSLSASTQSYTTQATAYSLLALAEEVRALAIGAGASRVWLDGRELPKVAELPGGGARFEIPLAEIAGKDARLELESDVEEPVGFVVRASWRRPAEEVADAAFQTPNGPAVYRVYTDAKGAPVDLSKVRAGDVLRVALVVRKPELVDGARYGYVAITDRLPAGFEPVQQDLATVASQPDLDASHPLAAWFRHADERASFVELHDDRVNVYFDTTRGDDLAATYLVRATTPGRFSIAPATAELMYEPASLGVTEPARVWIR